MASGGVRQIVLKISKILQFPDRTVITPNLSWRFFVTFCRSGGIQTEGEPRGSWAMARAPVRQGGFDEIDSYVRGVDRCCCFRRWTAFTRSIAGQYRKTNDLPERRLR
jgi:hypothetical protein